MTTMRQNFMSGQFATQQPPKASYTNPSDFEGLNFASADTAFGGANYQRMPIFSYAAGTSEEKQLKNEAPYMTRENYEKRLDSIRENQTPTQMQPLAQDPQFQALMNKFSARGMQVDTPTLPPQIGQQQFGNSGIGSLGGGGGGGQTNVSLNLQGSATMNPQGANQNRGYPGMNFASAQQQDQSRGTMMFAEGGPAQQGVGSLDRGRTGIREIDIIRTYLTYFGVKPEQVPQMIQAVIKDGAKFSRIGNTMMSAKPAGQGAMQIYFYTVSKMPEFMEEVKGFIDKLKQNGISVIYMNREDQDITQAIQAAGISVQQSDRPEFKVMAGI